jgi:hypothetical protein
MDLQQIDEWATANGRKLNPDKSQVILIHGCRADIPPPTLRVRGRVRGRVRRRVRGREVVKIA